MISKIVILEQAAEWRLTAQVVEKDYVLGWVLSGIAQHPITSRTWVFKGGTCLKKCVLETYRFSEDLDFTLLPEAPYDASQIERLLREITVSVSAIIGIGFPAESIAVRERKNRAGELTFEASLGYRGPLAAPGPPKIRFDLTRHEPLVCPVEHRIISHPYPDALPEGVRIASYSLSELIAEKTRALVERTRPRDLYDVVILGAPGHEGPLLEVAKQKFATKGLALPTSDQLYKLASADEELRSEWENMLGHQLPALPSLDDFLARLPSAVAWLDTQAVTASSVPTAALRLPAAPVPAVPLRAGETIVAGRGIRTWGGSSPIEILRFAGTSHLLVQFSYHGALRVVEPYSLRRPNTGNLLLYGFERRKNGFPTDDIRAYKIAEMANVQVIQEAFRPRYAIELIEQAGVWRW